MSIYDYELSQAIAAEDYPFYPLLMALMRKADTDNADKLRSTWPKVWAELWQRYDAPGGLLPEETLEVGRTTLRKVRFDD